MNSISKEGVAENVSRMITESKDANIFLGTTDALGEDARRSERNINYYRNGCD